MRANDPPTLARVRVCVPVRVVCRARASAGTPSTPFVTKAHALRVCAPPHSAGFPFPTGRLDARARGGMHRTGGQRMTVRVETTAALLHPRVFPSRALWCVWPPVTTRSGSHHEAPASEGDTASGRGQRMTLRVKTTAASPASVFPSPAQARSLGSPAHQQHNTLAHSSPRAFKTVCARARWFARESPAQAHRCACPEQTLAPPALAHNTTAAGPCAKLSASPATSRAARVFFKNERKSLPSRRHGDAAGKHERMRETTYWSPLSRGSRP